MDTNSHESRQPKCTILVLEGMGTHHSQAIMDNSSNPLGDFLRMCRTLRIDIQHITGRTGVAASIATGATAEKHQTSGKIYPDPTLRINRLHTPNTVCCETLWDACKKANQSSLTIGWPNSTPCPTSVDTTQTAPQVIVGPEAIESRSDPLENWVLPPSSVLPDTLREKIRSLREHQQNSSAENNRDAYIDSTISIASSLLQEYSPDIFCCWMKIESKEISSDFEKSLDCFTQAVPDLLKQLHTSPVLIICVPQIHQHVNTVQTNAFLYNSHIETPPVLNDQDLAPLVLQIMNTTAIELPIAKHKTPPFNGKEQELLKNIGPFKPTMGQQRVFMQSQSNFYLTIGLDMYMRGKYTQAIPWLTTSLHQSSPPQAITALILSYLATQKHEELSKLSDLIGYSPVFADLATTAHLMSTQRVAEAAEKINSIPDIPADACDLVIQLLFRMQRYQEIVDIANSKDVDIISALSIYSHRSILIAAHRIGKTELASNIALLLLMTQPLRTRRTRFLVKKN